MELHGHFLSPCCSKLISVTAATQSPLKLQLFIMMQVDQTPRLMFDSVIGRQLTAQDTSPNSHKFGESNAWADTQYLGLPVTLRMQCRSPSAVRAINSLMMRIR